MSDLATVPLGDINLSDIEFWLADREYRARVTPGDD